MAAFLTHTRRILREGALLHAIGAVGLVAVSLAGCGRKTEAESGQRTVAAAEEQTAASCKSCHEEIYKAWTGTDHALANRKADAVHDAAALATFSPPTKPDPAKAPEMILGHKPLWQPLIRFADGRWQPHELAYDPARKEWFNVFGHENRQPGEWGHWTGRGMNWNSMCAQCHMTGYQKHYDAKTDSYHSTWVEQGVSCIQCHGPMPANHGEKGRATFGGKPPSFHGDRHMMMETCAPCHARNEALTDQFQPGDHYNDHNRVTLPVDSRIFYPDGQQRDEDFNWTSVLLSRMGRAGVTCMDCHDPHTTKTILPADNNQLCLQCHAVPGRVLSGGVRAIPIDPTAHSHHAADSAGNSCVACHMPTRNYMQRSPRHDHGWLKPDPLLTKELGIPNACTKCHAGMSTDWEIAAVDRWYGAKMDSRQRERTRVVAAAQKGAPDTTAGLVKMIKAEDIPAWRATLLLLGAPYVQRDSDLLAAARLGLGDPSPLVRSAAVQVLGPLPSERARFKPLLKDPVRLVRVDAEEALSDELAPKSPERRELDAYLVLGADQPAGQLRIAQDHMKRHHMAEAEAPLRKAIAWDPGSAVFPETLGFVLDSLGHRDEAAIMLWKAAQLDPTDAVAAFNAGLGLAGAGEIAEAERALREAVRRDPKMDRAWYNLGLLLSQTGRPGEAVKVLEKAESLAPYEADYPYARATILLKQGDRQGAVAAAQRALEIDPGYAPAAALIGSR